MTDLGMLYVEEVMNPKVLGHVRSGKNHELA